MKRALLIAGGTVGGLGAVLTITPPNLASSNLAAASATTATTPDVSTSQSAPTENTTASESTAATPKPNATVTKKPQTAPAKTNSNAANNSASTNGVSGSFTGDAVDVGYGIMQVKITVANGKITDAVAVQTPIGRNQRWTDMAVPQLQVQTLAAQSAAIQGVSGASYTAYGWYKSLISALQQAGMPTGV